MRGVAAMNMQAMAVLNPPKAAMLATQPQSQQQAGDTSTLDESTALEYSSVFVTQQQQLPGETDEQPAQPPSAGRTQDVRRSFGTAPPPVSDVSANLNQTLIHQLGMQRSAAETLAHTMAEWGYNPCCVLLQHSLADQLCRN